MHVVPHSYNADFMESVEQFLADEKERVVQDYFDSVFDAMLVALAKDPTRSFSHFEVKHFASWYERRYSDALWGQLYSFLWNGQLEIINGGWVLHEDACPNYQDMLMNIYQGHQWLYKEFWYYPRVAWSLDHFGHSATNARLYAESGIEALFIANIDPHDKRKRLETNSMEFLWRPNFQHLSRKSEIFTHVFFDFDKSPFDFPVNDTRFKASYYQVKDNQ